MKEQLSKPTEKEKKTEENLKKILGDKGLEDEISKYQSIINVKKHIIYTGI